MVSLKPKFVKKLRTILDLEKIKKRVKVTRKYDLKAQRAAKLKEKEQKKQQKRKELQAKWRAKEHKKATKKAERIANKKAKEQKKFTKKVEHIAQKKVKEEAKSSKKEELKAQSKTKIKDRKQTKQNKLKALFTKKITKKQDIDFEEDELDSVFDDKIEEKDKITQQKQGLLKRLSFTGQLTRFFVYLFAGIPAAILMFLGLFAFIGIINPLRLDSGVVLGTGADFIIIAIIILTGVYGIYEYMRLRRVRKIDSRFPDFVRDLAESRRAGMTFTKAIMYSSKGNYGVLTPEIQKIARQISWGSSVENALTAFSRRVNTKLIKRTISLIIETSRSGGNVADVLEAASKDAREIKLIESERRASMMSYVAVIYVGMGVFLLILVVLCTGFLPSMVGAGAQGLHQAALAKSDLMSQADVTQLFFLAALIQSGLMGIVAGVFEEGTPISGVKHTFVMLMIVWLIFKLAVGGI